MADVIQLPNAASDPVIQHRRRGSYGRKVISLQGRKAYDASVRLGRSRQEEPRVQRKESDQQHLMEVLREMRQLAVCGGMTNIVFVAEINGDIKAGVAGPIRAGTATEVNEALLVLASHVYSAERDD